MIPNVWVPRAIEVWPRRYLSVAKKALGRGIGALLKDIETPEEHNETAEVAVKSLKPSPYQPRSRFEDEGLKELADSIREKGVIQPLLVEDNGDQSYTVIAGERRLRAAKMVGLRKVPVIVRRFSMVEKIEIALIENIQRENLTPVEEAQGYKALMDAVHLSQEEVARRVGKNRSTVTNALRLLKLPEEMLGAIDREEMSAGHARAILSVVNPSDQQVLFKRIIDQGISVREAEAQATTLNSGKRSRPSSHGGTVARKDTDPALDAIRQSLIDHLGTKVEIKGGLNRGRIEIAYFSQEDLDRLISLLGSGDE
jgi:ParB family chromosome partitioning protein